MNNKLIPLYGFLKGDTLGLLILAYSGDTIKEIAEKAQNSASIRVTPAKKLRVFFQGRELSLADTVEKAGLTLLDKIDVVGEE